MANPTPSEILQNFLYDTCTSLQSADFFNKVMQFDNNANDVATAEASFVLAGPPVLKSTIKGKPFIDYLEPMGAVQQYSLQEGKQIIPFAELGSKLKRRAMGSGQYSANLTRVLPRYGNLAYSLYSWLPVFASGGNRETPLKLDLALFPGETQTRHLTAMESEFFGIPFGLLVITGSAGGSLVHVEYLERCYIGGGGYARSAGNPMVVDNVSIIVTRPVPFTDADGNASLDPEKFKLAKRKEFTLPGPRGNANRSYDTVGTANNNA